MNYPVSGSNYMQKTDAFDMQSSSDAIKKEENRDYRKILEEKRAQLWTQIMNGETEETFRIGGQSFTQKEWERLLQRIDEEISREEDEKDQKNKEDDMEIRNTGTEMPGREEIMEMMMAQRKRIP